MLEISRELALMFDSLLKKNVKEFKEHNESIHKLINDSNKLKTVLLEEVASVGSLLINREDFLHLIFTVDEIADYAEAVIFRLNGLIDKKWKVDKKYIKKISELMELILEEMGKMRETMISLSFNPSKAIELSKSVEEVERKIDSDYRNLDIEILDAKMSIQSMLILRDIIQHLEKIADIGVDVIDLIKVLAIST
jgi:uncharacterized protein Yka (UPF0111/DUF47 family)